MYSGLNSLFTMLGGGQKADPIGASVYPPTSMTRTEDELKMLATAFLMTLKSRTDVDVIYRPYRPAVDDEYGNDRVAIPAHIDIVFKDLQRPVRKTHVISFSGHDQPATHIHYFKESDTVPPEVQNGYLFRKHSLPEALEYLEGMDPRWQFKQRVLVPS